MMDLPPEVRMAHACDPPNGFCSFQCVAHNVRPVLEINTNLDCALFSSRREYQLGSLLTLSHSLLALAVPHVLYRER